MSEPNAKQLRSAARVLRDAAGLSFDGSRRHSLRTAVMHRMHATGCADPDRYLARLAADREGSELRSLIDEATVQETCFHRNPPQVRALRQHIIPDLVRTARAEGRRSIEVWSAGCSTGEEAYTVAMLFRGLLPAGAVPDLRVLGSDVSGRAVAAAQVGRYGMRAVQLVEPADLDRWFTCQDGESRRYTVTDEIRRAVSFQEHNLARDPVPFAPGQVDLILCRNVMIYLTPETTRALLTRLHLCLRDGGYLLLGHAETLWQVSDDFLLVPLGDAFAYRRSDSRAGERRRVLPDRRTEDEGPPIGLADRRRAERRQDPAAEPADRPAAAQQAPAGRAERPLASLADGLHRVHRALAEGRDGDAADLAGGLAEAEPLCQQAHYLAGLALANQGRHEEAVVSLRRAAYLDPADGFAQFLLARALDQLGHGPAATRAYRTAAAVLAQLPPDAVGAGLPQTAAEIAAACRRLAVGVPLQPPPVRGDDQM